MLDILLKLLAEHAGEIGTFVVTAIIALLRRWFDKKKIKKRMIEKGMDDTLVKAVMNGESKKDHHS